jgi:hypothetical protein
MLTGIFQIDLPEARHAFPQLLVGEEPERTIAFDLAVEHQFGSGKKAYGHAWRLDRREATSDRVDELGRDELIPDLRGAGRYVLQTVVAHADTPHVGRGI